MLDKLVTDNIETDDCMHVQRFIFFPYIQYPNDGS